MHTIALRANDESAWQTYLRATMFLGPTVPVWLLPRTCLFPKLQLMWKESGATGCNIQWLMDSTSVVMTRGALLAGAVFLVVAFVELFGRSSLRRPILAMIVFLFNTIIILSLAAMCLAALYAAPGLRGN